MSENNNTSNQDKYLFLFSIVSVQEFIAQSRKTVDLWAGSMIVSELMQIAIDEFKSQGGKIIFPNLDNKNKDNSNDYSGITNLFLGLVENVSKEELKEIGKEVYEAVRNYWENNAQEKIKNFYTDKQIPPSVIGQIEDTFDIRWAFYPLNDDYASSFAELEKVLGSVKDLRFPNNSNLDRGRRCSVDGIRIVKFYRKKGKDNIAEGLWNNNKNNVKPRWLSYTKDVYVFCRKAKEYPQSCSYEDVGLRHIAEGEALSAVSFIRRLWYGDKHFPSTAEIAAVYELAEKLKLDFSSGDELNEILAHWHGTKQYSLLKNNLTNPKIEFNFQWFFGDYDNYINKDLQEDIEKFKKQYEINLKDSHKYYALIMFDGDSMGKHLAGIKSPEEHKEFSARLSSFARSVVETIKYPGGRSVYSGGDDFLGFSTIPYLFNNHSKILKLFQENVKFKGNSLTGSFGIVIAHYATPLGQVIESARKALDEAKDRYAEPLSDMQKPKNATGIIVYTKSKISAQAYMKNEIFPQLGKIVDYIVNDQISSRFIFNFLTEHSRILSNEYDYDGYLTIKQAMETEFKRLLKRSISPKVEDKDRIISTVSDFFNSVLMDNSREISTNLYIFDAQNITSIFKTIEQISKHYV